MVQIFDKVVAFAGQLGIEAAAIGVCQKVFDAGECVGCAGVELFAKMQGLLQRLTCIGEAVDHSQLLQTFGTCLLYTSDAADE